MGKLIVTGFAAFCLGVATTALVTTKGFEVVAQMSAEGDIYYVVAVREHLETGNLDHAKYLLALQADCLRRDLESRRDNWFFEETEFTRNVMRMAAPHEGLCESGSPGFDGRD